MNLNKYGIAVGLFLVAALMLAWGGEATQVVADNGPKAKSVILIWLWGGGSQLDTFDPKPDAGFDYTGPFDSPIETNVDGIMINELLPQLAQQGDKYSIIRSMTHGINAHETATYLSLTGRMPSDIQHPSIGSVVSYYRGYNAGYDSLIPPFIVLTKPQGRFADAGFLGAAYRPFATGGDPNLEPFAVDGIVREGVTREQQESRRAFLGQLDALGAAMPNSATLDVLRQAENDAYELILGDGAAVFDLSQEPDELRDRYGRNAFGQSCLAARRLVEKGVPFVMINYEGWDTHKNHFTLMRQMLPELDAGMATLLQDLHDRDMLDDTIVWWTGEFGHTPKIQWEMPYNGGRSHYGAAYSAVLAGGGFKGGEVVGRTDARAEKVLERPVYPSDVIGSIYDRLGIPLDGAIQHPDGRMIPILPPEEECAPSGGLLTELFED